MLITPQNLNIFFTALDNRFWQAYSVAETWHEQVVTIYPTGTEQWLMGWIGMLDKLRVWNGPRQTRTPAPQTYTSTVLNWELTEQIDKFKLADDTYGIYAPTIEFMGMQSRKWPDYNIRDLIEGSLVTNEYSGTIAQTGPDGVSFWNTAHPVDFYDPSKGTYVNDYGSAGTVINGITVGGAFSTNAWATVWSDMASRKSESGEKLGLMPDMTMVPLQMQYAARTLLQSQFFAPPQLQGLGSGSGANAPFVGAMDNPLRGGTDLMVNYDLSSVTAWYMLTTKKPVKPFGWVLREAPMLIPRVSPDDPVVFDTHQFLYGVEARGVAVWSFPWLASRSGV